MYPLINWLVLDEADEMLDMGFKDDLNAILSGTPIRKRVLFFSARCPREFEALPEAILKKPEITIGSKTRARKYFSINIMRACQRQVLTLKRIADYYPILRDYFFCRTKIETSGRLPIH